MKLELKKLETDHAKVTGGEFAIENYEDGKVYLTSKSYMDKLFKVMGYRSLSVIKILEEFAGKVVSDVGTLQDDNSVYIDETTDSFIVAKDESVEWVRRLYERLEKDGYKIIETRRYDTYFTWDQITVESPAGTRWAFYLDMLDEALYVLCLYYDEGGNLTGIESEGNFSFTEGDASLESLFVLISNPVNISVDFTLDKKLSLYEYAELLRTLGYLGKKRKKYHVTDEAFEVQDTLGNLEAIVDIINESSWLQQRITSIPGGFTFKDACDIISLNLDRVTFWRVRDWYIANAKMTSDFFALDY